MKLKNVIIKIPGEEILIHLQNIVGCLKILIKYLGFGYNQIYEPSCIFYKNKTWVYNKMHISK